MKNFVISVTAAASLVFSTGCGQSTCEQLVDGLESYAKKGEACQPGEAQPTEAEKKQALEACENSIDTCNDEDVKQIEKFADCLSDVNECKVGEENAYGAAFLACALQASNTSDACNLELE